jgi:hypothetical protein
MGVQRVVGAATDSSLPQLGRKRKNGTLMGRFWVFRVSAECYADCEATPGDSHGGARCPDHNQLFTGLP